MNTIHHERCYTRLIFVATFRKRSIVNLLLECYVHVDDFEHQTITKEAML